VEVTARQQKSLVLIRAREVATNLAIPVALLDPDGAIVFFNRAAEALLGTTYEAAGELASADWMEAFQPRREDGTRISMHELPVGVALTERRPHHMTMRFTGFDGVCHTIELTAFPLIGREQELFGAMAIFWHR
jgi:PAS domain-containing protein